VKNLEISDIFKKMADLLEIRGGNPFRIRAYRKAAYQISSLGRDISGLTREDLMKIPGIGSDLAGKIGEYLGTGRVEAYEKMKLEHPEDLVSLINIPGVGPKTAGMIYEKYGVTDITGLERLVREHKLASLPGIRKKTEENILKGIEMIKRNSMRHPLGRVRPVAQEIVLFLSVNAPVEKIEIAGSIRRWKETINDIDIVAASKDPAAVMKVFTHMPDIKDVLMKGPTKSSVVRKEGIRVDLRVVEEESYGSSLAYFTGSKEHNIRLRKLAAEAGMEINEYGIFRGAGEIKLGGREEKDIYDILGLQYVPPELREDTGEIEASMRGDLPGLLDIFDIRGDLHIHSNWSDGRLDLEEIVKESKERGYGYAAVTDHSQGLHVARGLTEERLIAQMRAIDVMNNRLRDFRLLSGVEANIRTDGSLDVAEDILKRMDVVIASVHSGFKQTMERMTGRILTAMKNPYVSIIAHPTGRLLGERESYEVDMKEILRAAGDTGTSLEINSYPLRLDLAEPYIRTAKSFGVPIVINTDAHNAGHFDNMIFGVSAARRGWLEKHDVLNTLDCTQLLKRLKKG
jgi:DNA polymerase (family 10)